MGILSGMDRIICSQDLGEDLLNIPAIFNPPDHFLDTERIEASRRGGSLASGLTDSLEGIDDPFH
jgi:hypothetical protein